MTRVSDTIAEAAAVELDKVFGPISRRQENGQAPEQSRSIEVRGKRAPRTVMVVTKPKRGRE